MTSNHRNTENRSPFFFPFSSKHGSSSSLFVFPHFLSFLPFLFLFLLSFIFYPPFLPSSTELINFLQVRGSFLSLYYSSYHVSPFLWSMCHLDTCSRWHSPHHMVLMPCVVLPWFHVAAPGHAMWHHPPCITRQLVPRNT